METDRFDTLTKHLAQTPSRRRVVKGLVGGLAAAGLAVVAHGKTEAAKGGVRAGSGGSWCTTFCARSAQHGPGSSKAKYAQCIQVCGQCGAGNLGFNCDSNQYECFGDTCQPSTSCAGTCADTCC